MPYGDKKSYSFFKMKGFSGFGNENPNKIIKKVKKDIKGAVSQVKSDVKNISELLKGRKPWKGHGSGGPGELMEGYPRWTKTKSGKKTYEHKYWKK